MRSHTWPRGRSLLCMSGFILELPGVRFCQGSGEMRGFYQRLAEVCQRCGAGGTGKLRCAAEAQFTCAVGSQAGVLALSLDLLQTSFPRRSAAPAAKQNREERNVQHSTPVLAAERGSVPSRPRLWITRLSEFDDYLLVLSLFLLFEEICSQSGLTSV